MQQLEFSKLSWNGFWGFVVPQDKKEVHAYFRSKLKNRKIFEKYLTFQNSKAVSKENPWYTEEGLGF